MLTSYIQDSIIREQQVKTQKTKEWTQAYKNNIRTKQIEQIKKSKRQILQKYCQQIQHDKQQQQLYFHILNNSNKIFEQHHRYLQLLRESLNWNRISKYKHLLPEILLAIEKYYQQYQNQGQFRSLCLMMLIQCIAMIYFQTNVEFDEINKRCLRICFDQFNKNKVQQVNSTLNHQDNALIRSRCLVAIENITACDHMAIMSQCQQLQILRNLQDYTEDFPVQNLAKINILSIYGNLISYHLSHSSEGYWFPYLLKQCVQQNYNPDVLNKACEVLTNLLQLNNIKDKIDIVMEMECLYFGLVESQIYVQDMEFFILYSLQCIMEYENHKESQRGVDIYAVLEKIDTIVDNLRTKFALKIKIQTIPQIYLCLAMIYTSLQSSNEQKLQRMTKQLCNFWVDLEDDTTYNFDFYFLRFLRYSLTWASVCYDLYKQSEKGVAEDNAIKATTWEIIEQYLKQITLERYELAYQFLSILEMPHINSMIQQPYRQSIIEKVEGCFYSSCERADITIQAEQVLKLYAETRIEHNNFYD